MKTKLHWLVGATALISFIPFAHATEHLITAKPCLLANTSATVLASYQSLVLAKVDDATLEKLSDAKHDKTKACGGFKNVTQQWQQSRHLDYTAFMQQLTPAVSLKKTSANYQIRYEKEANQLINQLNPDQMWNNLISFSSSRDRHANSKLGIAAANWLKTQVATMAEGRTDVSIYTVATDGYKQPSVVVKIGESNDAGIVVGAHLDTVSSQFSAKPGADDDGSGSMTALEALRNIFASGIHFKKPVYFIWYAAEEEGLVGSQSVVAEFKRLHIPVAAVLHFDLTGYAHKNEKTIWIIDDNVDKDLTKFLESIIKTYTKRPVQYTRCGYACSDHASWTDAGFAAAIPAESRYEDTNPSIHTSQDTIDKLNKEHMADYAKIAIGFVVELAEPV